MKSSILRSAIFATSALAATQAHATLLLGIHNFGGAPPTISTQTTFNVESMVDGAPRGVVASGYSGSYNISTTSFATGGSNDGTYGDATFPNPPTVVGGDGSAALTAQNTFQFSLTNISNAGSVLQNLYFDVASEFSGPTIAVFWRFAEDLFTTPLLPTTTSLNSASESDFTKYQDVSYDLSSLPAFSPGKTVVFTISTTDVNTASRLDNIAIMGAIPEPASLMGLGCVLGSGLLLRRRSSSRVAA